MPNISAQTPGPLVNPRHFHFPSIRKFSNSSLASVIMIPFQSVSSSERPAHSGLHPSMVTKHVTHQAQAGAVRKEGEMAGPTYKPKREMVAFLSWVTSFSSFRL